MLDDLSDGSTCPTCADYIKKSKSALPSLRPSYRQGWRLDHDLLYPAQNSKGEKVAKLLSKHSAEVLPNREDNLNAKSCKKKTMLHCAVEMNDIDITKSLLQKNADIEARSDDDSTPLHIAARMGNTEIAEVLLHHGADANSVCASTLGTLLQIAVKQGKAALVDTLLKKGTNMNANVKDEGTLLVLAAKRNHLKVVKVLLNNGADIDARDKDNENILSFAVENRVLSLIELILEAHSDPENNRGCFYTVDDGPMGETRSKILEALPRCGFRLRTDDPEKPSLLFTAVCRGYLRIAEYFVNSGTNVNESLAESRFYGGMPLHIAVQYENLEIARLFIKNNANVNAKDGNGNTPLHYALRDISVDITKLLLAHRADLKGEPNVVHKATMTMSKDFVEMLFRHEPTLNVNRRNKLGMSVLYRLIIASRYGDARLADPTAYSDTCIRDIAKILLERGANVNARAKDGTTALHVAAQQGYKEVVELLLEHKADVTAVEKERERPLHYAARNGNEEIVKILLDAGAMVDAKETTGDTALHIAIARGHTKVVKLLMENGADIAQRNKHGSTSLHIAAAHSNTESLEIFLNVFDDVNCIDGDGATALHVAMSRGSPQTVKVLLDHDCDINIFCNDGKTALNYAMSDMSWDDERHDGNMFRQNFNNYPPDDDVDYYDHDYDEDYDDRDDDKDYDDRDDDKDYDDRDDDKDYNEDDDYDDYDEDGYSYDEYEDAADEGDDSDARSYEVIDLLNGHIMTMVAMNRFVCDKNLRTIHFEAFERYRNIRENGERQIECMRQKKIGVSNVSYYDVLTNDMNRLAVYARNKDIVEALETEDHKDMFYLYFDMLKIRFKKGQRRAGLLDQSLKSLSFLTGCALPDLLTGKIFNYLNNKDLENLIKAGPCVENDS